jgi:outer membrane protein TolC
MTRSSSKIYALAALFCGLAVATALCETPDSITLPSAIKMAVKNSAALNAAKQGLAAAQARTSQAKTAWLPDISGTGSYSYLYPLETIPFGGKVFQLYPANNWDFHVGADYLLFDFGKRQKAINLSTIGEQALQTGTGMAAKFVSYQAIVSFESLLSSAQMIAAKQENVANLSQHLDFVKKKLATGSSTEFDVLRSEVDLTNAQTELTNLNNDLAKQQIGFRQLLGLDESAPANCMGAFDSSYHEPAKDSLIEAALKQRTEIDLMNVALKAGQAQLSLARLEMTPALVAHVSAGEKNGYIPNLDQLQFNTVAAAQISVPIFDGRKTHYHIKELEAHLDSLRTILDDLKRTVRTDVLKAIADVKSARENLFEAATNIRLAGESRRIATLQYEAGVIPNLDLLDAENKYTQAKFARVQSEFRYTLSRYALMQVAGFDFVKWADAGAK